MSTKKITVIDRQTITDLRPMIEERLQALGEELGIELSLGSGTYSNEGYGHFSKLNIKVLGGVSQEEADFKAHAHFFGMKASDFGMEWTQGGETFTLCGLRTRNRKYPFLARKASDGKVYKFTEEGIMKVLNAPKEAK